MGKVFLKAFYGIPVAVFVVAIIMLAFSVQLGEVVTVIPTMVSGDSTMSLTDLEGTIKVFVMTCIVGYVWGFTFVLSKQLENSDSSEFAKWAIIILQFLLIINTFLILMVPKTLKGMVFVLIANIIELVTFAIPLWFATKLIYKKEIEQINEMIKKK